MYVLLRYRIYNLCRTPCFEPSLQVQQYCYIPWQPPSSAVTTRWPAYCPKRTETVQSDARVNWTRSLCLYLASHAPRGSVLVFTFTSVTVWIIPSPVARRIDARQSRQRPPSRPCPAHAQEETQLTRGGGLRQRPHTAPDAQGRFHEFGLHAQQGFSGRIGLPEGVHERVVGDTYFLFLSLSLFFVKALLVKAIRNSSQTFQRYRFIETSKVLRCNLVRQR
jgi:hypothetical protein